MKKEELTSYDLSRIWFNFCFDNPEKISPNHTALYFFCIEHCNRLGWKEKFGLPTTMAKEAIGIRSYNTYIKTLHELVGFGFIKMIEISKNQYSSNIIALSKNDKALNKALDKAFIKHTTKQSESTQQSISSIDKQITNKQITNNNTIDIESDSIDFEKLQKYWNSKTENTIVPKIEIFSKQRKSKIKNLVIEHGKDSIIKAINNLFDSDFCTGKSGNWKADFDFLTQQSSFIKLIEGSYSNNKPTQQIQSNVSPPSQYKRHE
jgi:hypothetical protein